MKHLRLPILISLLVGPLLLGAEDGFPEPDLQDSEIINESYNFRKNREPDMSDSEYALYEQVVPMAVSQPQYALTLLETMVADEEEESAAFLFVLANVHYSANELEKAEQYYKAAVADYPDFLRAWLNLGVLYYSAQRFEEAVECLVRTIELGETDAETYELLGFCLEKTDNLLASEMAYMQAYVQQPNNSKYVKALVYLYMQTKQYDRAEPMLRQLVKLEAEDEENWALYARMLKYDGRLLEAMGVLETAYQIGVTTPMEEIQLADLYSELNFRDEALDIYRSVMADNEDLGFSSYMQFVQTAVASEDFAQAKALLSELPASLSVERRMEVTQLGADIDYGLGNLDAARKGFEKVLEEDPMNGKALMSLGKLLVDQGELARAEFILEQASRVDAYVFQACIELAAICVDARRYEDGLKHLDRALKVRTTPELEQYRASLMAVAKR